MHVTFLAIQGDDHIGWDLVQKTFPEANGDMNSLSVKAEAVGRHADKKNR